MQPKKFSGRYFAGVNLSFFSSLQNRDVAAQEIYEILFVCFFLSQRGVTPQLQNQLTELASQKQQQLQTGGDKKRRKLVVVSQNCIEPLQALRDAGNEVLRFRLLSPISSIHFKSHFLLDLFG